MYKMLFIIVEQKTAVCHKYKQDRTGQQDSRAGQDSRTGTCSIHLSKARRRHTYITGTGNTDPRTQHLPMVIVFPTVETVRCNTETQSKNTFVRHTDTQTTTTNNVDTPCRKINNVILSFIHIEG